MQRQPVSVVIPNWNGAVLLKQYLPRIIQQLRLHHADSQCIVVDDGSSDDSIKVLKDHFPEVLVVARKSNGGFGSAVNQGISHAKHEHTLLINNDVAVEPEFLTKLQEHFQNDPLTFAVASLQKQELPNGKMTFDGFNTVCWENGHLNFRNTTESILRGAFGRLAYCTAGCSLFARSKIIEIGGFAEVFDPFYYEDTELGLQALKRGWRLHFEPNSVVFHCPGTTSKQKDWSFRFIPVRNYFILHWLVLDSPRQWFLHLSWALLRIVWWSCTGRFRYAIGFALALGKLRETIEARRKRSRDWQIPLSEIITD